MAELTQPPAGAATGGAASNHTGTPGDTVVYGDGAAPGGAEHPKKHKRHRRRWLKPQRLLTVGGLLVTFLAGAVGLTFTVDPGLSPCIGGSSADFTDTDVISHVSMGQYVIDTGGTFAQAAQVPNVYGVEIPFSYHTASLRGALLLVRTTLLAVGANGVVGDVVESGGELQDEALQPIELIPNACSATGSDEAFVQIPNPQGTYQVLLALYSGTDLTDRLALARTQVFHG